MSSVAFAERRGQRRRRRLLDDWDVTNRQQNVLVVHLLAVAMIRERVHVRSERLRVRPGELDEALHELRRDADPGLPAFPRHLLGDGDDLALEPLLERLPTVRVGVVGVRGVLDGTPVTLEHQLVQLVGIHRAPVVLKSRDAARAGKRTRSLREKTRLRRARRQQPAARTDARDESESLE